MQTLFAFCRKTGRSIRTLIDKLVASLAHGKLRLAFSVTVPFFVTFKISYDVTLRGSDRSG
ncbi:hypothetical protein [Notoacmeibacter sp. MSK16QG-6]|uniref:hypothetical protein n=1 Tax=Notoacmeibacter sp. MSK16QG-6 TaxID=2957982 RepID=UPI00209F269D|nr:hypothetical protein [Notoacmeibacter sp. MSK16QG-6]MCP1201069.1 hypothetical protein [Notoacmeibacter sp. MSK16QG-6]